MPNTPVLSLPYPVAGDPADVPADMQALAMAIDSTAGVVPIGCIELWPVAAPPAKWLICDGAVIPAQYDKLIALIGPNVPDMRDRVPVGTSATKPLRVPGGSNLISTDQLPAHTHEKGGLTVAGSGVLGTDAGGVHSHQPSDVGTYFVVGNQPVFPMIAYFTNQGTGWIKPGLGTGSGGNFASYNQTSNAGNHAHTIASHAHALNGATAPTGAGAPHDPPYLSLNYIIRAG